MVVFRKKAYCDQQNTFVYNFFASVYNMLLPEYKLVLLHTKATSPKATDRTGH